MDILADISWETQWPAGGGLDRLITWLEQEPHEELVDQEGDDDRQRDTDGELPAIGHLDREREKLATEVAPGGGRKIGDTAVGAEHPSGVHRGSICHC
jgi:hypothetical protein